MQIFYIFPQKVKSSLTPEVELDHQDSETLWASQMRFHSPALYCTETQIFKHLSTNLNNCLHDHAMTFVFFLVMWLNCLFFRHISLKMKDGWGGIQHLSLCFVFLKMSEVSVSSLIFQTWSRLGLFTYSTSFNHSFTFSETWRRNTNPDYDYLRRCEDNTWRCSRVQT